VLRPRFHKVLSDLWDNKIRSLLVIASIAVGLIALGLIASMYVILTEDMSAGYTAINPANITISISAFDEGLVNHIKNMPGVRQVEGIHVFSTRVKTGPDEWSSIDITAVDEFENKEINLVKLEQGAWPPKDKEIVVDRYKFPDLGIPVGEFAEIKTSSGKVRQMRLVGVVHDQTIGATQGGGGFFIAPIQGYITSDTLEWLEQPPSFNRLQVTVEENPNDLDHLREMSKQISKEIENDGYTIFSTVERASNNHPNSVYVQAISSVLFLLGLMVVFLSAFLITNTLSALLNQQVHQVGVMKTIGGRQGQIVGIYLLLIFFFGLAAFLLSVPVSGRAAYVLVENLAFAINMDLQGFRYIPLAIFLQLVIALLVPQAAGFVPILQGTRVSAVEALSGYSQPRLSKRKHWIDRLLESIRGLSRPQLISLRNTFRRKWRLLLTLITLTLGGAIFIATFNVQGSLNNYIGRIGKYFLADVNLTLGGNYRISEIQSLLFDVPGVGQVEGWASARSELIMPDGSVGESIGLLAPPAGSKLVEPILLKGRWLIPGDENAIAVSERFMEVYPDLKPGDTLTLKINGEEVDFGVVGLFQLSGRSGGYVAYTTFETLSRLTHQPNSASLYRIMGDHANLTPQEQKDLGLRIENYLESQNIVVAEVEDGSSLSATASDGLNILTGFLLIMASLIALVGSIGLAGTMSMNVLERTREIGIMRAIGASDRAVINLVMIEGLLIGMISWFFGVLLSFPISTLLSNAINLALFGAPSGFTFTVTGLLVWLGVVLLLSVSASIIPARNAARLTIREVLSYE
jgi:putative ABC transport system permease protein